MSLKSNVPVEMDMPSMRARTAGCVQTEMNRNAGDSHLETAGRGRGVEDESGSET